MLPLATTMSAGGLPAGLVQAGYNVANSQIVLSTQQNIGANGSLAINAAEDQKLKDEQTKAQSIDAYFETHDMPLEGTGMKMVLEAEKNGLDWRLLPAIAVRESTGGKHDCTSVKNNPFGWGSCKIGFKSVDEAIETLAKNLGGNNPGTAFHYDNKTTTQILHAYNPPSIIPRYAEQVVAIMSAIGDEDLATTATIVNPNS